MPKENLLIILNLPEDRSITDKIRERFPYINVSYHQLQRPNVYLATDQGLPEGCYLNLSFLSNPLTLSLPCYSIQAF